MGYLQVIVGSVVIADEAQTVSPYRHRCVQFHSSPGIQGGYGRSGAIRVGAVGYLQVCVGTVVIASERTFT